MTTKVIEQGPVDALVGRLRAHAEAHEYIANADYEQRQWMHDLYDAADEIERLREALKAVADMTDADNPESYRCDDREGCLDTVFATATNAMTHNYVLSSKNDA